MPSIDADSFLSSNKGDVSSMDLMASQPFHGLANMDPTDVVPVDGSSLR